MTTNQFRIVSGSNAGFFSMSTPLDADDAARAFLNFAAMAEPGIDTGLEDELRLWMKNPTAIYYVGYRIWRVAISPVGPNDVLPTAN